MLLQAVPWGHIDCVIDTLMIMRMDVLNIFIGGKDVIR